MGSIALFEATLGRSTITLAAAVAVAAALWSTPSLAGAQDEARAAYARGTAAFENQDYRAAQMAFAEADAIQPNPFALESAIKSAIRGEDPVGAMELADRAEGRDAHPGVTEQVKLAREKFASEVGRVVLQCPVGTSCTLRRSGQDVAPGKGHWVRSGSYPVEVEVDGRATSHVVEVKGGGQLEWYAPAPQALEVSGAPGPADAPADTKEEGGLSPAFFVVGAALTAVAAGVAVGSGVQAVGLNDDFQNNDDSAEAPGRNAQTRANVFWAVTGALGATSVVFLVLTDWSGDGTENTSSAQLPTVDVRVGLGSAFLVGTF